VIKVTFSYSVIHGDVVEGGGTIFQYSIFQFLLRFVTPRTPTLPLCPNLHLVVSLCTMAAFPELPPPLNDNPWSPNVYHAYQVMADIHRNATRASRQGDNDPMRLRFHRENLINDCVPLLVALETYAEDEHLPTPWIHSCAESLGALVSQLQQAESALEGVYV